MSEIIDRALDWLAGGDTGLSSKAICFHMLGRKADCSDYPRDPADLGRCLRLLNAIPEWRVRIGEMAQHSPGWAGLVKEWDHIDALMFDEVGHDWSKGQSAPRTYHAMQLAISAGFRLDPNYDCTFAADGTLRGYSWKGAA